MKMRRVEKPWGYEIWFADTPHYAGKLLCIKKGARLSLQFHREKDETVYLQSGRLLLDLGPDEKSLHQVEMLPGDAQRILPKEVHRLTAIEDCVVFEVSTPHLDDVVRLRDDYGRER